MEPGLLSVKNPKSMALMLLFEFTGAALITYSYNFNPTDYQTRAFSYFVAWLFAVSISGAHFNPATTLAVYLYEQKYRDNLQYFIFCVFTQICGCYAGILISFMFMKSDKDHLDEFVPFTPRYYD